MSEPRRRRFSWWDGLCVVLLLGTTSADAITLTVIVLVTWLVVDEVLDV